MEIVVRKSDLLKELQLVQGIVERKNSIPILSNVLLETASGAVRIAATDLDVSLRCGCAAQVVQPGALTLQAKKIYEIVRSLPDSELHLKQLPDAWAALNCEKTSFRIAGLPREDFPALPEATAGKGIEIAAATLRELIARTAFAITAEDARYYLAGALLVFERDGLAMVATDGHRLAYARRKVALKAEPHRVLVPRKALNELLHLIEGEETLSFEAVENHLVFTAGGRTLASKTIEGNFPAYEKVIGIKGDKNVKVGREALSTALRRVSLVSSERSRAVKLALAPGRLELSASSPDLGEAKEEISLDYEGAGVEVGFNAQYFLDFLAAAGGDSVAVALRDSESQGVLTPTAQGEIDYRYVVMPMRL